MARKRLEKIYFDISGEEVQDASTTYFALDGTSYEIDLTDAEREDLIRAREACTAVARIGSRWIEGQAQHWRWFLVDRRQGYPCLGG